MKTVVFVHRDFSRRKINVQTDAKGNLPDLEDLRHDFGALGYKVL